MQLFVRETGAQTDLAPRDPQLARPDPEAVGRQIERPRHGVAGSVDVILGQIRGGHGAGGDFLALTELAARSEATSVSGATMAEVTTSVSPIFT